MTNKIINQRIRKILYYAEAYSQQFLIPNAYYRKKLDHVLSRIDDYDPEYIAGRVYFCNGLIEPFKVSGEAVPLSRIPYKSKTVYYYDFRAALRYFPAKAKTDYIFGDVNWVPDRPSIVKSRPINDDNANAVLLKMEQIRHFRPIKDRIRYEDKKDLLVWRGAGWQAHRKVFLTSYWNHPLCDVGQVNDPEEGTESWVKSKMTVPEQLRYKFILSIEGNDVATNLKWISQSNSLCFMTKPKMETWFMESRLIGGVHYVELRDDYSDLDEKLNFYSKNPEEAKTIIRNFNSYFMQFTDLRREELISQLVAKKYLELSGQL